MKKIDRKKVEDSGGFPISRMEIIEDAFLMKGKECSLKTRRD